ncbi:MAG TPA: hypothetical protein VKE22_17330 [Haliangiales bacterium]|nr:hypothetical protein [Haliangiales bacterium]
MSRWARARCYLVPSAVFLAALLAVFWRLWTPIGERHEFGIDSQWQYWGDLTFQIDALREGELPLWDPYDRAGYPFHLDPQTSVLYPVNWAFVAAGLATGSTGFWLINLKQIFHFWLACVGMYAFLRRRGLPPPACYAGGFVLLLSAPFMHHLDLNLNWSFAWAPWALYAVDVWAERPTARSAAAVATTMGLAFLAGSPPAFWYAALVVGPYGVWAMVHHRRSYLRSGLVLVGLFAGMVVAQAVATAALLPHTVRADRDLQFVVGTQFGVADVVGFLVPRLTRLNHYLGVVAIFCVGAALALKPEPRRLVLAGLAVFGVLCAWGLDGEVLPAVASAFPPFRLFRYAMRYTYVAIPALAILAAEGMADLAETRRRGTLVLVAGLGASAIFLCGYVFGPRDVRPPWGQAFAAFAVGTWVVWFLVTAERRRLASIVAAVALFVDLWVGHGEAIERNLTARVDTSRDGEVRALAADERFYDRAYLRFRPGLRLERRDFGGYEGDPLALQRYALLRDAVANGLRFVAHANVRLYLEDAPKLLPKSSAEQTAMTELRKGVYRIDEVAPAVAWVPRAELVDDARAAIRALFGTRPGTAAVLERPTLSADEAAAVARPSDGAPVAGKLVELGRNRLVATVEAPADGIVVVAEAYFPGWEAWVDGQAARIFPANGLFRGLRVGPGAHRIEMRYRDDLYLVLAGVELVALAAAAALLLRRPRTVP